MARQKTKTRLRRSNEPSYKNFYEASEAFAEERRLRPIVRRVTRSLLVVMLAAILFGSGWLWTNGMLHLAWENVAHRFITLTSDMGMNLEQIYMDGRARVSQKEIIMEIMEVYDPTMQTQPEDIPILALDLDAARAAIEAIGWVKHARIERQMPNMLHIRLTERLPGAVWEDGRNRKLVDVDGAVIVEHQKTRYSNIPTIIGDDVQGHVTDLMDFLQAVPEFRERVSVIERIGGRRWDVQFKNGVLVKLPEEDAEYAWKELGDLEKDKQILQRAIKTIDMRDKEKLYMELMDEVKKTPSK